MFINDRSGDTAGARQDFEAIRAAGAGCKAGPLILTDAEPGDRVVKVPIPEDIWLAESPEIYRSYVDSPEATLA